MSETVVAAPADAGQDAPETFDAKLDSKLTRALGLSPDVPETAAPEAAEVAAEDDLLANEAGQQPVPEGDDLELPDGQIKRVTKDELKKLAKDGLEVAKSREQLDADRKQVAEAAQFIKAKANITPQVFEAGALVKYYEQALAQYQNVNWAQAAQQDPIATYQARAAFDQLRDGYAQAAGQLNQAVQAAQQIDQRISQSELQAQFNRTLQAVPEWKDEQKRSSEFGRIRDYLTQMGIRPEETNQLTDARHLLIVRDAMRYRQAVQAKQDRANQVKDAPSMRPGAAPALRQSEGAKKTELVKQLHQAKDPDRKKALFDATLAAKLGL